MLGTFKNISTWAVIMMIMVLMMIINSDGYDDY